MVMTIAAQKVRLHGLLNRLVTLSAAEAIKELQAISLPDARFLVAHPVNECLGVVEFVERFIVPLQLALSPLMRRDDILMAGTSRTGSGDWVSLLGHYVGNFTAPLFNIRPHAHLAFMRYG